MDPHRVVPLFPPPSLSRGRAGAGKGRQRETRGQRPELGGERRRARLGGSDRRQERRAWLGGSG
uniref:Uncharacterized protein n=1 Tax=Oryza rufipogon TaxID=4529 RepID=A0A0E0PVD5_ORYRU